MGEEYNYFHNKGNEEPPKTDWKKIAIVAAVAIVAIAVLVMIFTPKKTFNPYVEFVREFQEYDEFSVILTDMKEEGFIFKNYYHQYKITYIKDSGSQEEIENPETGEKVEVKNFEEEKRDWIQVSKDIYKRCYEYLGMSIIAKTPDGKITKTAQPEGHHKIGHRSYGYWTAGMWHWYSPYSYYGWGGPVIITRSYYDDFRSTAQSGKTFYGKNNEYGTNGTVTQKKYSNSTFQQKRSKSSFTDRFNTKRGRSQTTTRSTFSSSGGK